MLSAEMLDDRIDMASRDGRHMVRPRLVTVVFNAVIMIVNLGISTAAGWVAAVLVFEVVRDIAAKRIEHDHGTRRSRLLYLVAITGMTISWTALPVLFWLSDRPAFQIFAMVLLSNQLIHTLAFTFRSPPVRTICGGVPALTMIVLPTCFARFSGVEQATIGFGIALALFYVAAAVRSNLATDIKLREAQDELERFAYYDALTSLANRRLFTDTLRRLIALSQRRRSRFALLLLDLDEFKQINDTLGHDAGDALLIEVGARLSRAVRGSDHVARLGGDEFAILLSDAHDAVEIAAVCDRIRTSFAPEIEFNGTYMRSSPSVGVALFPDDGDEADSLYKSADLALYAAKRSGRNTWRYGTRALRLATLE